MYSIENMLTGVDIIITSSLCVILALMLVYVKTYRDRLLKQRKMPYWGSVFINSSIYSLFFGAISLNALFFDLSSCYLVIILGLLSAGVVTATISLYMSKTYFATLRSAEEVDILKDRIKAITTDNETLVILTKQQLNSIIKLREQIEDCKDDINSKK